MRAIAVRFANYLYRRRAGVSLQSRTFSSGKEELTVEEEAERKIGWLLKLMFAGTASAVAYQFFPYMGDNLMQQSVSLLQVKDPLFKRMGASRLTRFAVDACITFGNFVEALCGVRNSSLLDEKRMKIVEMGGAQGLLNMLNTANDDRTRKAALKALEALSQSDEVLASLYHAGAITIIRSIPSSLEDADVERFKLSLMKRFQDQRYDGRS